MVKQEFNDDEIMPDMEFSASKVYGGNNKKKIVDLASQPAIKQITLEERKIKSKRSAPLKRRKSIKKKPIRKKTLAENELALLKYKLRFTLDSTESKVNRVYSQYKTPTDKLFNKIYANKNKNELGDKFLRRQVDKMNILQNENISALSALKLDRGSLNGNKQKRDAQTQIRSNTRNASLDSLADYASDNSSDYAMDNQGNRNPQVGAFPVGSGEDYPARAASIETMSEPEIIQAQDYEKVYQESLAQFKDFYRSIKGRNPHPQVYRGFRTIEDMEIAVESLQKQYNKEQDDLHEANVARYIEEKDEEKKDEEDEDNAFPINQQLFLTPPEQMANMMRYSRENDERQQKLLASEGVDLFETYDVMRRSLYRDAITFEVESDFSEEDSGELKIEDLEVPPERRVQPPRAAAPRQEGMFFESKESDIPSELLESGDLEYSASDED